MLHCITWSSYIRSFFTIWSVKPSTHLSRSIITLSLYLPKYPSPRLDSPVSPPPPQWAERAVREVARVLRSCARLCCAHPGMRCALERASDSREVSRAPRSGTATSQNTQLVSFLQNIDIPCGNNETWRTDTWYWDTCSQKSLGIFKDLC